MVALTSRAYMCPVLMPDVTAVVCHNCQRYAADNLGTVASFQGYCQHASRRRPLLHRLTPDSYVINPFPSSA